ncbi:MAG TPA: class I SAM-dependent methyltransferase [Accumulibacter sp.]|jgi:SAM-dependent methyltransferase|nr:class I SAM-dependent methyltransferase [Accumulibacter sp.]
MAHATQREFISILAENMPRFFSGCRVLEVGSLDINGSIRDFFKDDCKYIGLDIGEGKGVDVVCEGQKYDAPDGSFDHVISCEVMEHNPYWVETFQNMVRVCRPGGLVVMTCATTGRSEHGTSRTTAGDSPLTTEAGWEYYKNIKKSDFEKRVAPEDQFSSYFIGVNWVSYDLVFFGIKMGASDNKEPFEYTMRAVNEYLARRNAELLPKVRKSFAAIAGDKGFEMARSIRNTLKN